MTVHWVSLSLNHEQTITACTVIKCIITLMFHGDTWGWAEVKGISHAQGNGRISVFSTVLAVTQEPGHQPLWFWRMQSHQDRIRVCVKWQKCPLWAVAADQSSGFVSRLSQRTKACWCPGNTACRLVSQLSQIERSPCYFCNIASHTLTRWFVGVVPFPVVVPIRQDK